MYSKDAVMGCSDKKNIWVGLAGRIPLSMIPTIPTYPALHLQQVSRNCLTIRMGHGK